MVGYYSISAEVQLKNSVQFIQKRQLQPRRTPFPSMCSPLESTFERGITVLLIHLSKKYPTYVSDLTTGIGT